MCHVRVGASVRVMVAWVTIGNATPPVCCHLRPGGGARRLWMVGWREEEIISAVPVKAMDLGKERAR